MKKTEQLIPSAKFKREHARQAIAAMKQLTEEQKQLGREALSRMADPVNNPAHYTQGIECIEYIESHGFGFHEGNAIKYITRARHKGSELEDLKKARWYLDRLIARIEAKLDRR